MTLDSVDGNYLKFGDLFDIEEMQKLQDLFCDATGVASVITTPDGIPLTKPSNFTRLCSDIIRRSEKGRNNCYKSDSVLGQNHPEGFAIKKCLSGGLWDAGVSITVAGIHIANWLIGQVRNEETDDGKVLSYALEIDADPDDFEKAFREVPIMSLEKFTSITRMLSSLVQQLCEKAWTTIQLKNEMDKRARIHESMRKKMDYYAVLLRSIGDGVIATDIDGLIENMNTAAERMCGWSLNEAYGKYLTDVFDIINKITRDKVINPVKKVLETRVVCELENHTILRDRSGREYNISDSAAPIQNDNGEIIGVVLVFSDNTEKHRASTALELSEERFRRSFETSPDAININRMSDGLYVSVNPVFLDLTGYSYDEVIGKTSLDMELWVNNEDRKKLVEGLLKDGKIHGLEADFRMKDGSIRHCQMSASVVYFNGEPHILSITRDVSDQKITLEKLKAGEEKLRNIFDNIQDVFVELAPDGTILEISPSIISLSRNTYTPREVIGTNFASYCVNPMDGVNLARRIFENGYATDCELEVFNREGVIVPCSISGKTCGNGDDLRIVGSMRDISARKVAEKEREELQSQLQQSQKMESVGRLAGGIAHDFNNMLGVIIGHLDLALDQMEEENPIREDLEEARQAAMRSAELTRQLLAFARKQTVAPEVIDLNKSVTDLLKMLGRLIGENINLEFIPCAGAATVKMDPSQVDQILANLCVNAREAIDGRGKITIRTEVIKIGDNFGRGKYRTVPGDYINLTVEDTGCGMDEETKKHIFEPFFTTRKVGEGTGLGLSMVYGAVKQNEGYIEVTSEPGKGTVFKILIPFYHGDVSAPEKYNRIINFESKGETVMIVEDDPGILKMAQLMLEKAGFSIVSHKNPEAAVDFVKSNKEKIDLLLTDVVMPVMDGKELAERLKESIPGLKVLFMSGYTADVIASSGIIKEGINFIQKPFTAHLLTAKIREILDKKES
ncbi:PAS domain S-box protein [Myxococcota bacterium]|nr:PAS domain S-box protein [Myxococcota bacterium]MBU1380866.1 PAS domain S-box protein [Myxococcota bacterium]MBU1499163.1 PAS domain S-box protein [Myxococcota bacterium]